MDMNKFDRARGLHHDIEVLEMLRDAYDIGFRAENTTYNFDDVDPFECADLRKALREFVDQKLSECKKEFREL